MLIDSYEQINEDDGSPQKVRMTTMSEAQMMSAFREYDKNGDGKIDKEEMRRYVREQMGFHDPCHD